MVKLVSGIWSLAAVLVAGSAMAQVASPTPGAIGNEQQRRQEQIEQTRPTPQTLPQEAPVTGPAVTVAEPAGGDTKFLLKAVTFDTTVFLRSLELDAVIKDYVGHEVSFADLYTLANKINALYKAKGQVTARAVIAPQKVQNGVVHVSLVEGRLGKVAITGAKNTREDFIRNRISVQPGETLDAERLGMDIVRFNRTGDVQMRAIMRPGASFGETDLQLAVQEPATDMLDVFIDNQGVESTGTIEGGLSYRHNGLVHLNDRAFLYGVVSEGGLTGSASYDIPIDLQNTRLGANYQRNKIEVVHGPFGSLGISGIGQSMGINLTHPFTATTNWLFTGIATAAYSTSSTSDPVGLISDTVSYRGGAGLSLTYIGEDLLATLTPNISLVRSLDQILGTTRDFMTLSSSASIRAKLGSKFTLRLSASGQYSNERLLPADFLFQIGGPASARGYAPGTFAGDSGYFANLELHRDIGDWVPGVDLFAFTDYGAVYSTFPSEQTLNSAGAGLVYTPGRGMMQAMGSIAVPLKDAVLNQDDYRAYAQLLFHFDSDDF